MSEYVKDAGQTSGWKTISYHSAGKQNGGESDGAPLTAEGMDERGGSEQGDEGDEEAAEVADTAEGHRGLC